MSTKQCYCVQWLCETLQNFCCILCEVIIVWPMFLRNVGTCGSATSKCNISTGLFWHSASCERISVLSCTATVPRIQHLSTEDDENWMQGTNPNCKELSWVSKLVRLEFLDPSHVNIVWRRILQHVRHHKEIFWKRFAMNILLVENYSTSALGCLN